VQRGLSAIAEHLVNVFDQKLDNFRGKPKFRRSAYIRAKTTNFVAALRVPQAAKNCGAV